MSVGDELIRVLVSFISGGLGGVLIQKYKWSLDIQKNKFSTVKSQVNEIVRITKEATVLLHDLYSAPTHSKRDQVLSKTKDFTGPIDLLQHYLCKEKVDELDQAILTWKKAVTGDDFPTGKHEKEPKKSPVFKMIDVEQSTLQAKLNKFIWACDTEDRTFLGLKKKAPNSTK